MYKTVLLIIIVTTFVFLSFLPLFPQKTFVLEGTYNPRRICVSESQVYIGERNSVNIYKKDDFKFVKSFGSKGDGPGEFQFVFRLSCGSDYVTVSDAARIHFFDPKGNYKRTIKSTSIVMDSAPIGNKFVGLGTRGMGQDGYMVISFFDANLERGKEVYQYKRDSARDGKVNPLDPDVDFCVSGNLIFINGIDDQIHCFDIDGKEIRTLPVHVDLLEVSPSFKEEYIASIKSNKRLAMYYEMYKSNMEFPKYFPIVRYFRVDNNKIYIITYRKKEKNSQCVIMDMTGKIKKETFVPLYFKDIRKTYPFDINEGILYQAIEDDDDGPAHLCVTELK